MRVQSCTRPSRAALMRPRRHIDFVLPVEHDLMAGHAAWERKAQRGCMDHGAARYVACPLLALSASHLAAL